MLSTLDKTAVSTFLKMAVNENNVHFIGYRIVESKGRKINAKQALLDMGVHNQKEIWLYIKILEVDDCFRISKDRDFKRDFNSEMFEFKKIINKKKFILN